MTLTTKELGCITDALVSEQLALNKTQLYADMVTDAALKEEILCARAQSAAAVTRLYALL